MANNSITNPNDETKKGKDSFSSTQNDSGRYSLEQGFSTFRSWRHTKQRKAEKWVFACRMLPPPALTPMYSIFQLKQPSSSDSTLCNM